MIEAWATCGGFKLHSYSDKNKKGGVGMWNGWGGGVRKRGYPNDICRGVLVCQ